MHIFQEWFNQCRVFFANVNVVQVFFFESEFMYPKISLHVLKHNSWRSLDHRKLGLPPLQPDARCNIEYRWMQIPSFIQSKMFVYTRWFFFVGGLFRVGGLFKTYWQGCNFLVDLTAFDVATQFISQASYSNPWTMDTQWRHKSKKSDIFWPKWQTKYAFSHT